MSRRATLRNTLLQARDRFAADPGFAAAERSAAAHLAGLIETLEPDCLGVYWAVRSEFNAAPVIARAKALRQPLLALPEAQSRPVPEARMAYRAWNGDAPLAKDACGIATSDGALVTPDVVIVPCVGFTRAGYRMGYGGGYFDRWLAEHPHVTSIGVAWSGNEVAEEEFAAEPHDVALSIVVTEKGVVG